MVIMNDNGDLYGDLMVIMNDNGDLYAYLMVMINVNSHWVYLIDCCHECDDDMMIFKVKFM